jgi:hypothetical protein
MLPVCGWQGDIVSGILVLNARVMKGQSNGRARFPPVLREYVNTGRADVLILPYSRSVRMNHNNLRGVVTHTHARSFGAAT